MCTHFPSADSEGAGGARANTATYGCGLGGPVRLRQVDRDEITPAGNAQAAQTDPLPCVQPEGGPTVAVAGPHRPGHPGVDGRGADIQCQMRDQGRPQ